MTAVTASGTVSFTASRHLSDEARDGIVTSVLTAQVPHAARYVTGACTGGDAFTGRWLYDNRPEAEHVVIVPADRSRISAWWRHVDGPPVTVIEMPPDSTYRDRNLRLVAEADAVFAFPAWPEEDRRSWRSGTWQTVRLARLACKLASWHCVTPPYQGRIEQWAPDLLAPATWPPAG